jgi:lysophospholipase L1-like esterase
MRTPLAVLVGGLVAWVSVDSAAARPCSATAPGGVLAAVLKPAILVDQRLRIVCLGSSSTQGVGASDAARTSYPAQLAAILAGRARGRVEVVNKGVGGETVADNLARLERDVVALRPGLVIWQVGTNDALRRLPPAEVRLQLLDGIRRLRAAGATVVLMDPQPLGRPDAERAVAEMAAMIRQVSAETGAMLFSRRDAVRRWLAAGTFSSPATLYARDGLHMNDASYRCLAEDVADLLIPPAQPAPAGAPEVVEAAAPAVSR